MDTVSIHQHWMKWKWGIPKCKSYEAPIGYGAAFSDDDLDDSAYSYAGSRSANPEASEKAEDNVAEGFEPPTLGGGAIPPFYDLSEKTMQDMPKNPRATLAVRITKGSVKQRYSGGNSIIKPAGSLDLYEGKHAKGDSAAISSVEVFFERPDGNNTLNGKEEYGSLFNPYWQARIAPVSTAQRSMAQLMQGLVMP